MDRLMTVAEVAAYLSVSESTVRRLVSAEKMPSRKIGGAVRFSRPEVDEWSSSWPPEETNQEATANE